MMSSTSKQIRPPQGTSTTSTGINQAIAKLKELGINFLALDFDRTILDIHTGGRWKGSPEELYPHVRPIFIHLMEAVMASSSSSLSDEEGVGQELLHVAVVTFTRQIQLVRGILDQIVGPEVSQRIPIRGRDGSSWKSTQGKQSQMAGAVEELKSHHAGLHITQNTTLLIDDDKRNIEVAVTNGVRAIWFNPEKPHLLLHDIQKLVV